MEMISDDEIALSEHIEEFSQRFVFCLSSLFLTTILCFADVKEIVRLFQAPAIGVKFLQFAPGEYFFASVKISVFCGILISSPLILYQIILYLIPAQTCTFFPCFYQSNYQQLQKIGSRIRGTS
jgi:sec-independent protein translocase protein TatC